MVSSTEYSVLNRYKDVLVSWSMGHQVTVTRTMWCDVYPILQSHLKFSGTIGCGYCVTQLCRYAYKLWAEYHEYLSNARKSKKSNG